MKSKTLTISLNEAKKLAAILYRAVDAELPIPFEESVASSKFCKRVRAASDAGKVKPNNGEEA